MKHFVFLIFEKSGSDRMLSASEPMAMFTFIFMASRMDSRFRAMNPCKPATTPLS